MPQGAKKTAKKKAVDPYKAELAERIDRAFKSYNAKRRSGTELLQKDLGRLVAKKLGLKEPLTQPTVSGWMNPANPSAPDNPTIQAIAEILETDKAWLVFGGTAKSD